MREYVNEEAELQRRTEMLELAAQEDAQAPKCAEEAKQECIGDYCLVTPTTVDKGRIQQSTTSVSKKATCAASSSTLTSVRRSIAKPREVMRRHSDTDGREHSKKCLQHAFDSRAMDGEDEELIRGEPQAPPPDHAPWMRYLEAKLGVGHNKLDKFVVLQNSRLGSLEASMTKQAALNKEKMDALEKSMEIES